MNSDDGCVENSVIKRRNNIQTVAVPKITFVVRSATLTLQRTTTYWHGNIIHVETEYLWESNQTRTSTYT